MNRLYSSLTFSDAVKGDRVKVHLNLGHKFRVHGMKTWSVKKGGITAGHVRGICLRDVEFVVQKSGNRRVIEKGEKTVHAFAVGTVEYFTLEELQQFTNYFTGQEVKYNPHIGMTSFCTSTDTGEFSSPVYFGDRVWLSPQWRVFGVGLK